MDIVAISKIILLISVGLYGVHLFLVLRRIFRQTSYLRNDLSCSEKPRLPNNGDHLHKNVNSAFEFEGESLHEEAEEKG